MIDALMIELSLIDDTTMLGGEFIGAFYEINWATFGVSDYNYLISETAAVTSPSDMDTEICRNSIFSLFLFCSDLKWLFMVTYLFRLLNWAVSKPHWLVMIKNSALLTQTSLFSIQ